MTAKVFRSFIRMTLILLIALVIPLSAYAEDGSSSETYQLSDDVTAELTEEGVLIITGSGSVPSAQEYVDKYAPYDFEDFGVYLYPWDNPEEGSPAKKVIIAEGITALSKDVMKSVCKGASISLPSSLRELNSSYYYDDYVYDNGIAWFEVSKDNPNYASVDGVLYTKDMKTLITYPTYRKGSSFRIPDGVETISTGAFYACNLERIEFPDSLKEIHSKAVAYCRSLDGNKISLPDGLRTIGEEAFFDVKISKIKLPSSLKSIGDFAVGFRYEDIEAGDDAESSYYCGKYGGDMYDWTTHLNISGNYSYHTLLTTDKLTKTIENYALKHGFNVSVKGSGFTKKAIIKGIKSKTYAGKPIKHTITVRMAGKKLRKGKDYTVKYLDNKGVGKGYVLIKGKGKYKGIIIKSFSMRPKKPVIKKLSSGKKSVTVKWKNANNRKDPVDIDYEIEVCRNKSFKGTVYGRRIEYLRFLKSKSTIVGTVDGLKRHTKYYVRMRLRYGHLYHSQWTKVKTIRTK